MDKKTTNKTSDKLTIKQKAFCREYAKTGNGLQSLRKAGYKVKNDNCGSTMVARLLHKVIVQNEISRLTEKREEKSIMSAKEVMQMFTDIAQGKVKDQFGLDASLNDRLRALQELAKRTVDIENRVNGKADNVVKIELDWKRDE